MKKAKWKPEQRFYKIEAYNFMRGEFAFEIGEDSFAWKSRLEMNGVIRSGNCFRTKREATAKMREINRAIKQILKGDSTND